MNILPSTLAPRLLAGAGTLALLAAVGLLSPRPARTAGGPIPVTVANAALVTTAADNPAKQPVETQNVLSFGGATQTLYTVPAGKRLVIEYVNVVSNVRNDSNRYSFVVIHNNVFTNFSLVPDGSPYAAASQRVLLYADAGSQVTGYFVSSGSNVSPEIYDTLTGYLVDAR